MSIAALKESMDEDYFDKLSVKMQTEVRLFLDRFGSDYQIEEIECRSRSGFIPHSWNKGGLELHITKDLSYFYGGGYSVGIPAAQKVIDKYTEQGFKDAKEAFIERYAKELKALKIKDKDVSWNTLDELDQDTLANEYNNFEDEFLQGEYASTLHTVRIVYQGNGEWSVAVMHRISDAPYHRTCDGFKEWSFKATTIKQLKANLNKLETKISEAFV